MPSHPHLSPGLRLFLPGQPPPPVEGGDRKGVLGAPSEGVGLMSSQHSPRSTGAPVSLPVSLPAGVRAERGWEEKREGQGHFFSSPGQKEEGTACGQWVQHLEGLPTCRDVREGLPLKEARGRWWHLLRREQSCLLPTLGGGGLSGCEGREPSLGLLVTSMEKWIGPRGFPGTLQGLEMGSRRHCPFGPHLSRVAVGRGRAVCGLCWGPSGFERETQVGGVQNPSNGDR